jgi:CheY-like chemotaxis protein
MEMGPMSRVLLVEDNSIYRRVFHQQFREHFPALVIGEAGSGDESLQKILLRALQGIFGVRP